MKILTYILLKECKKDDLFQRIRINSDGITRFLRIVFISRWIFNLF